LILNRVAHRGEYWILAMIPKIVLVVLAIAYSHYWPPLGGVNGSIHNKTASGERWQDWVGQGAACPGNWAFGTIIIIDGHEWVCIDRGSAIGYTRTGLPIIDFLEADGRYAHKTPVDATVIFGFPLQSPDVYNVEPMIPWY
jgi:hypothetical protein